MQPFLTIGTGLLRKKPAKGTIYSALAIRAAGDLLLNVCFPRSVNSSFSGGLSSFLFLTGGLGRI